MLHRRGILVCLFLVSLYSLQVNSESSDSFTPLTPKIPPGYTPDDSELEGGLWMIMENAEKELRSSPKRIIDAEINAYLQSIVCRLVPEYCDYIRVYVTRIPYFNASMAPNGMMTIWTGLLLRTYNEAQVAAILGHELAHFLLRHSLNQFEDASKKMTIGALVAAPLGLYGIHQLFVASSIFAYSRNLEREADKYGIQLLSEAGYDPFEMVRIWENIIQEEENDKLNKRSSVPFFATHPAPEDRLERLTEYAEALSEQAQQIETTADTYQRVLEPYWHDMLTDELNLNYLDKSEFILTKLLANNVAPAITHYYKGELHRLRKAEGDIEQAIYHYEHAATFDQHPAALYRSLGLLQLKEKQQQRAYDNFRRYLELEPDAADKEMIQFYLSMEK